MTEAQRRAEEINARYGLTGDDKVLPELLPEANKAWTNDLAEIGKQVVGGAVVDLPEMLGKATTAFSSDGGFADRVGKKLIAGAKEREEYWKPNMEGRGKIAEALISGGRAVAPSVATMGVGLGAGALGAGALASTALGMGASGALFGGSQYQDTFDKLTAAGVSQEEAHTAALKAGAVQGGSEALANIAQMRLLGKGAQLVRGGIEGSIKNAVKQEPLKDFAKAYGTAMVVEPATEVAQDIGTEAVERGAGVKTQDYGDIAYQSGTTAMGMTTLLAPFGLRGHFQNEAKAKITENALDNPKIAKEYRQKTVDELRDVAKGQGVDKAEADDWHTQATAEINAGKPVTRTAPPRVDIQALKAEQDAAALKAEQDAATLKAEQDAAEAQRQAAAEAQRQAAAEAQRQAAAEAQRQAAAEAQRQAAAAAAEVQRQADAQTQQEAENIAARDAVIVAGQISAQDIMGSFDTQNAVDQTADTQTVVDQTADAQTAVDQTADAQTAVDQTADTQTVTPPVDTAALQAQLEAKKQELASLVPPKPTKKVVVLKNGESKPAYDINLERHNTKVQALNDEISALEQTLNAQQETAQPAETLTESSLAQTETVAPDTVAPEAEQAAETTTEQVAPELATEQVAPVAETVAPEQATPPLENKVLNFKPERNTQAFEVTPLPMEGAVRAGEFGQTADGHVISYTGHPFTSANVAQAAIKANSDMSEATHEVVPFGNGFAVKQKAAPVAEPLPAILTQSKAEWVAQQVKAKGLKKESPGYAAQAAAIGEQYETELDKAFAAAPFEVYANHPLNKGVPQSVLQAGYEALRSTPVAGTVAPVAETVAPEAEQVSETPEAAASVPDANGFFELSRIDKHIGQTSDGHILKDFGSREGKPFENAKVAKAVINANPALSDATHEVVSFSDGFAIRKRAKERAVINVQSFKAVPEAIDKAISEAPTTSKAIQDALSTIAEYEKNLSKSKHGLEKTTKEKAADDLLKRADRVVIKTPTGSYTVLNTKEHLEGFKKRWLNAKSPTQISTRSAVNLKQTKVEPLIKRSIEEVEALVKAKAPADEIAEAKNFVLQLAHEAGITDNPTVNQYSDDIGGVKFRFTPKTAEPLISQEEATSHLIDNFGMGVKRLLNTGKLILTTDPNWYAVIYNAQIAQGISPNVSVEKGSAAHGCVYDGKIYINLLATDKDKLVPTLVHELGEHIGLKGFLGEKEYQGLQDQIKRLSQVKGNPVQASWNYVAGRYTHLEVGSEKFISEVIARIGETQPNIAWYRRLIAKVKSYLIDRNLGKGFLAGTMTADDLNELLKASARAAMTEKGYAKVYGVDPSFSLAERFAPNGKPSNLNAKQYEQVRTPEFKKWFGDWLNDPANASKVLDENGEPLVVYHGTEHKFDAFSSFTPNFFTADSKYAKVYSGGKKPMALFLNIRNPLDTAKNNAALSFYNDKFVPYFSGKFPRLSEDLQPLNDGESVSFIWADKLFSAVRHFARQRETNFDGVIVDEGGTTKIVNSSATHAYVPLYPSQIKSAIGNNGEFSASNDDIRFMFAGEKAQTANLTTKAEAVERIANGEDKETVRKETGWHQGADKQWRFEIDDSKVKFNPEAEGLNPLSGKPDISSDLMLRYLDWDTGFANIPLIKLIHAPEIFSAYTWLKNILVAFTDVAGAKTTISELGTEIQVNDGYSLERKLSALLHEIQHAIQYVEDFAPGGNIDGYQAAIDFVKDVKETKLPRVLQELEEAQKAYRESYNDEDEKKVKGLKRTVEILMDTVENPQNHSADYRNFAKQRYFQLPGEVEARNTEARQNFTAEQRRERSPESTQDTEPRFMFQDDIFAPKTEGLDMSLAARMRRARDLGFDTTKRYYHGTTKYFEAFDLSKTDERPWHPEGMQYVVMSSNPTTASTYAGEETSNFTGKPTGYDEGGQVMPLVIRKGKTLTVNAKGAAWNDIWYQDDTWSTDDLAALAKEKGYDTLVVKNVNDNKTWSPEKRLGDTVIVFDPTNIRSVNARFDPAQRQSADVMFSLPETEQFKDWFGNSKVVGENGKPEVLFRSLPEEHTEDKRPSVEWFTNDLEYSQSYGDKTARYFLRIENPFDLQFRDLNTDVNAEEIKGRLIPAIVRAFEQRILTEAQGLQAIEKVRSSDLGEGFRKVFRFFQDDNRLVDLLKDIGFDGVISRENNGRTTTWATWNKNAVKSATDNSGAYSRDTTDVMFSLPEDRFYSALEKGFEKAPAQIFANNLQIKGWLKSNAPKLGIKEDEIYWSGINDWLDVQGKAKITRDDVLNYLKDNGVKVEDVELAGFEGGTKYPPDSWENKDGYVDSWEGWLSISTPEEMAQLKDVEGEYEYGQEPDEAGNTKHTQHTLPGGEKYRELVVTIPTVESWGESDATHFGDVGKGKQIAWLRMNERTDAEGNQGTFLEEIQSQRGAEGKTKGFATAVTDAQRARHTQLDGIPAWKITEAEYNELQELNKVINSTATPSAPFITTAKNRASDAYILLLMKKALSSAIDNGHKFVSWTTGEQQADRYNLSKEISEVSLTKEGVFRAYDKDKAVVLTKYTTDENEIATYIGAELAHNLVTQRFQKRGIVEAKRLEGLELSTEPSWTKTMYGNSQGLDGSGKPSLILQAASELARKFGGKTGTVKLSTGEQPALIVTPEMKAKVLSSGMPMFMFQEENKDDISARQNKTDSAAANQQAGQQLPSADELSADREKDDELLRTSLLRVNGFTPDGKVKEVKVGDSKIVFQVRWNIPTDVHISSIRTAIAKRGAGAARKALSAFLRQTDSQNLSTSLEASPLDNKTNAKRLEGFYESLGFKSTGKTINPMGDKEMVREPRFMFQEDIFDKKPQREAPEVEQVSEAAPEVETIDLTDTFKKLDSRTRKSIREKTIAEIAEHKDRILYINDNFIDILSELEKLPGFEIKC